MVSCRYMGGPLEVELRGRNAVTSAGSPAGIGADISQSSRQANNDPVSASGPLTSQTIATNKG